MPPKILYIITSTTRGGAEYTLLKLIKGLDRSRCVPVCVVSLKKSGQVAEEIAETGVPVESLAMGLPLPGHAAQLAGIIRKYKPDIVHAFLYRAIQFARLAVKNSGAKLVTSPRGNYRIRSCPARLFDRLTKTQDELVICESVATRDFLVANMGYALRQAIMIRNGVDTDHWQFSARLRGEKRALLGLEENSLLLVSAGRLDELKGHKYLVEALSLCRKTGLKATLAIVGGGPLREELERQIAELGIAGFVQLPGEQEDLLPWLCAADIFALPSICEGTPNALLEAMSVGLPCVASNVDGIGEVASDGGDALLVAPKNPPALAQALSRLACDPALRGRLGSAARAKAMASFSLQKMFAAYEAAYGSFVTGGQ